MNRKQIGGLIAMIAVVAVVIWYFQSQPEDAEVANGLVSKRAPVSVNVTEVERGDIQSWVFAEGTARSVRREYLLFNNQGRVEFIANSEKGGTLREGDFVKKDTLLARQDQRQIRSDIASAEATVLEAQTQVDVAEAKLDQSKAEVRVAEANLLRKQTLRKRGISSQAQLEEAESQAIAAKSSAVSAKSQVQAAKSQVSSAEAALAKTKVPREDTELITPIDGQIAYLNVNQGDYYLPSVLRTDNESNALKTVPMVVIDPDNFEIRVQVPSYERGRIKVGQTAHIARGAVNGQGGAAVADLNGTASGIITGQVYSVTPAVDPGARGIDIKIRTDQARDALQDGVYVTVWIAADERKDVVVAPFNAILYSDNQPYVFIADKVSGIAMRQEVTLGLRSFEERELKTGVKAGQLLVTTARHQLTDGAPISILETIPGSIDQTAGVTK